MQFCYALRSLETDTVYPSSTNIEKCVESEKWTVIQAREAAYPLRYKEHENDVTKP